MYQATDELKEKIKAVNGRRRRRTIDDVEIKDFFNLLNEKADDKSIHTIRVYSYHGFVANSYSYRADITCLEAIRQENGTFKISAFAVDAKRSHGIGALVTVNGRGYEV